MMRNIIEFLGENWLNISNFLIIVVGLSAVWIYKAQEKEKIKDAASLIVLQIDELQARVQEIQSYITDRGLNFSAFYESLPLLNVNYWNKYKHLFIRKIDNKSYNNFNRFFQYISCMQEQQELLRNLQKNYFFVKQAAICNVEFNYICETLKEVENSIISSNPNFDMERFWAIYKNKQDCLSDITNKDSLTAYTPMQISSTLQAVLKQYNLLEISGTEGYRKLCRIAKMIEK